MQETIPAYLFNMFWSKPEVSVLHKYFFRNSPELLVFLRTCNLLPDPDWHVNEKKQFYLLYMNRATITFTARFNNYQI